MTICVLGGDGFIGRRIVRNLAAKGHNVVSLDINVSEAFKDLGSAVQALRLDIGDFEQVVRIFAKFDPQAIINLSYLRNYRADSAPRDAFRVNILGMDNCFEAARLCGQKRVVYASSVGVNGYQSGYGDVAITEADPPKPINRYGEHKVFNEHQAEAYRERYGMVITGVRCTHVADVGKTVGTNDHVQCIVGPALGRCVTFPYRDSMRCVIHAEDMAEVFVRIALSEKPRHGIYTSGGETLSMSEIADMVKLAIPDAKISFENDLGDRERSIAYRFDNSRLISEFGMQYMPYRDRIPLMVDAARKFQGGTT